MRDTVFPDAASTTETRTALPSTISPARSSRRVAAPKRRMASPARSPALQAGLPTMGASSTKANGAGMQYRDCSTPCHTRASASSAAAGCSTLARVGGWYSGTNATLSPRHFPKPTGSPALLRRKRRGARVVWDPWVQPGGFYRIQRLRCGPRELLWYRDLRVRLIG